jgi:hypothetical protein
MIKFAHCNNPDIADFRKFLILAIDLDLD